MRGLRLFQDCYIRKVLLVIYNSFSSYLSFSLSLSLSPALYLSIYLSSPFSFSFSLFKSLSITRTHTLIHTPTHTHLHTHTHTHAHARTRTRSPSLHIALIPFFHLNELGSPMPPLSCSFSLFQNTFNIKLQLRQ